MSHLTTPLKKTTTNKQTKVGTKLNEQQAREEIEWIAGRIVVSASRFQDITSLTADIATNSRLLFQPAIHLAET